MKNPEWSPGTWTYDPEEAAVVSDHEPHIIAPLFGQCEDADGYLLAASKELYESLELARKLLQEHHSAFIMRSEHHVCPVCTPNPFFQIDSALAKARGESQ